MTSSNYYKVTSFAGVPEAPQLTRTHSVHAATQAEAPGNPRADEEEAAQPATRIGEGARRGNISCMLDKKFRYFVILLTSPMINFF